MVECVIKDWWQEIEVGYNWPLISLGSKIKNALGSTTPKDYKLSIVQDGHPIE